MKLKLRTKLVIVMVGIVSISWSLMLSYQVLQIIGATELMWFLFWTNIPMLLIISIISKLMEKD